MKKNLASVLGTVLFAGLLFAAPAAADTPGCVSHAEFDDMVRGLSSGQVANRFDTSGWYIGAGEARFRRGYQSCWSDSRIVVVWYNFDNGLSDDWAVRDA